LRRFPFITQGTIHRLDLIDHIDNAADLGDREE
jgi:hypothetical protein